MARGHPWFHTPQGTGQKLEKSRAWVSCEGLVMSPMLQRPASHGPSEADVASQAADILRLRLWAARGKVL